MKRTSTEAWIPACAGMTTEMGLQPEGTSWTSKHRIIEKLGIDGAAKNLDLAMKATPTREVGVPDPGQGITTCRPPVPTLPLPLRMMPKDS